MGKFRPVDHPYLAMETLPDIAGKSSHPWEIHDLHDQTNSRVGANMAEHAIVSLAEMVARNPPISTNGTVPYLGTELSVRWKYFEALMASIVAVNFLVIALSSLAIKFAP